MTTNTRKNLAKFMIPLQGYIALLALSMGMIGLIIAFMDAQLPPLFRLVLTLAMALNAATMPVSLYLLAWELLNGEIPETHRIKVRRAAAIVVMSDYDDRRNYRMALARKQGIHTKAEWRALLIAYRYTCLACGRRDPDVQITKDHVIPVSMGGSDGIDNLQPLCASCNSKKGARVIDYRNQWLS